MLMHVCLSVLPTLSLCSCVPTWHSKKFSPETRKKRWRRKFILHLSLVKGDGVGIGHTCTHTRTANFDGLFTENSFLTLSHALTSVFRRAKTAKCVLSACDTFRLNQRVGRRRARYFFALIFCIFDFYFFSFASLRVKNAWRFLWKLNSASDKTYEFPNSKLHPPWHTLTQCEYVYLV